MKKIFLVSVVLILLAGCSFLPEPPEEDLSGFKDCGESEECIMQALDDCEKAFAEKKVDMQEEIKAEVKVVVYGMQEDKCKVKYELGEIQAQGADETIEFFISFMENKEMTCLLPPEKISLIKESKMEDLMDYCSGSLIDSLKLMQGLGQDL